MLLALRSVSLAREGILKRIVSRAGNLGVEELVPAFLNHCDYFVRIHVMAFYGIYKPQNSWYHAESVAS